MTPIFKKKRILLIAVTLGISFCGIANAQNVPVKDPQLNSSVDDLNFKLSMVTEQGSLKGNLKR